MTALRSAPPDTIAEPAFRGLTWDHPRGRQALEALQAAGGPVAWDVQPLEGFEEAPIGELAERYDVIVLDHPHLGEAHRLDCLQPLDAVFGEEQRTAWTDAAIGCSLSSYVLAGRLWALPLDAAAQVCARRPDRLPEPPATWEDVLRLSERVPTALSLAGPHAILTLLSMTVAFGCEPDDETLWEPAVAREALGLLATLYRHRVSGSDALNPIALLQAMAEGDDIALCPLVFGYVNYATPAQGTHAIAFSDAPCVDRIGSILGGTGLALSKRARVDMALREHLALLLSEEAQTGLIPAEAGQPSHRAAWRSPAIDGASGGFFSATRATLEAARVRPRFDGFIAFQREASARLRAGLAGGETADAIAIDIEGAFAAALDRASEPTP